MNFERRNFLRIGAAGVTGTMLGLQPVLGESPNITDENQGQPPTIEFKGGTGSLHVRLNLTLSDKARTPGVLDLQLDNFNHGSFNSGYEKSLIMKGKFRPTGPGAKDYHSATQLYRSYFSENQTHVFVRLIDDQHETTLLFRPTRESNFKSVTVWHDTNAPQTFEVDENRFVRARGKDPQDYIRDYKGQALDLKGQRQPPEISAEELERALDNHPDYLSFVRGKKYQNQHAAVVSFACAFTVLVVDGGALFVADWEG